MILPACELGATAFRIDVDDAVISRIRHRLLDARWPPTPDDDADWKYGTDVQWLRRLVEYWTTVYDWRAAERELNRWPQFRASAAGYDVHFYHVKGSASRPRPLLLTHGWPGSVLEFLACIERLAQPGRFGGDPEEGFDLVIPSLPGFGFSAPPPRPLGPRAVATIWRRLMTDVLGYRSFVAQGGDWGAAVTTWLGIDHADVTKAIHVNMIPIAMFPPGCGSQPQEAAYHAQVAAVRASEFGYFAVQSTKPQTMALALVDNPLGFAAWVCEKFRFWGDTTRDLESRFSRDKLITNLMMYLVNGAEGTSIWMYRGHTDEASVTTTSPGRVVVPTGVACFPFEFIPYPPRSMAERVYPVVRWTQMRAGGHFAAAEEPEAFSAEIRQYFAQVGF